MGSKKTRVNLIWLLGMYRAANKRGIGLVAVDNAILALARNSKKPELPGLGIQTTENGKPIRIEGLFVMAAAAISKIKNQTERVAAAQDIFGYSGVEIIHLSNFDVVS